MSDIDYRNDIDGLRAVAVIAVILFHLELTLFSGGFIGVDVFFVISGYLISKKILLSTKTDQFSFRAFYAGRIRRLMPALLSTILGTLVAGVIFYSPNQLVELSLSSISSFLSVANIQFYMESGYWDADSWQKPLLHMWSLSVEEQFYLIWPLIILILFKSLKSDPKIFTAFSIIALASLYASQSTIDKDQSAAFYLTPFRMFEFCIGAMCCELEKSKLAQKIIKGHISTATTATGVSLIAGCSFLYGGDTPFPGLMALLPCLGAALVIIGNSSLSRLALANPVMKHLGKISYSLYLIHWPVFVFVKDYYTEFTPTLIFASVILTYVLAVLQYFLVEQKFRYVKRSQKRNIELDLRFYKSMLAFSIASLILTGVSFYIFATGGLEFRYKGDVEAIASLDRASVMAERAELTKSICRNGKIAKYICGTIDSNKLNILVIGDSHGPDGVNILSSAYPEINLLVSQRGGCPFVTDLSLVEKFDAQVKKCDDYNKLRYQQTLENIDNLNYVVIANRLSTGRVSATEALLKSFPKEVLNKVIILGAGPQFKGPLANAIVKDGILHGIDERLKHRFEQEQFSLDAMLAEKMQAEFGVIYLEKMKYLCPKNICQVVLDDGHPMMFDNTHLTIQASEKAGKLIRRHNKNLVPEFYSTDDI